MWRAMALERAACVRHAAIRLVESLQARHVDRQGKCSVPKNSHFGCIDIRQRRVVSADDSAPVNRACSNQRGSS